MNFQDLQEHDLVKMIFESVRPVMIAEHQHKQDKGKDSEYELDEYEFYLFRVGNRIATLLTNCEQLSHTVYFITNFRQTTSMDRVGITRAKHLRYNVENYIIRTQTVYDLVLKLVDAIFHLTNTDSQCRDVTILQNLKVKRTDVPNVLKPLRKKIQKLEQARHTIVHRGSYQDDDLYRLELFSELEESYSRSGESLPLNLSFLPDTKLDITHEFIRNRKARYSRLNTQIFKLIFDVLTCLQCHFEKEKKRLKTITGR